MISPAYPNPTRDKVFIILNDVVKNDLIEIHNATEALLKSVKVRPGKNELSTEDLPNGIYFCKTPNYETIKLIKQ